MPSLDSINSNSLKYFKSIKDINKPLYKNITHIVLGL